MMRGEDAERAARAHHHCCHLVIYAAVIHELALENIIQDRLERNGCCDLPPPKKVKERV